jgi:AcrR family transcriptional regulator
MTKQFSSVWTRAPRAANGRQGLSRDQIVAAAMELLDAEGLDALSMRKLGAKLDAGATSLYWHVANKDELLELVLDRIWAEVSYPDSEETPWRQALGDYAYSLRRTLRAHPWAATLCVRMPNVGPNAFRIAEGMRRTMTGMGFAGMDLYVAGGVVTCYVLGQVIPELSFRQATGGEEPDIDSMREAIETLAGDYTELAADYREMIPENPDAARAMAFDFGLLCILDGLAARVPRP